MKGSILVNSIKFPSQSVCSKSHRRQQKDSHSLQWGFDETQGAQPERAPSVFCWLRALPPCHLLLFFLFLPREPILLSSQTCSLGLQKISVPGNISSDQILFKSSQCYWMKSAKRFLNHLPSFHASWSVLAPNKKFQCLCKILVALFLLWACFINLNKSVCHLLSDCFSSKTGIDCAVTLFMSCLNSLRWGFE